MSLYVTATDFSEVATNAVHYACQLAGVHGAKVVVLHSYSIPIVFADNPMPAMTVEESHQVAEEQMNELLFHLRAAYPQLSVEGEVTYGDITDCLEEYIPKHDPELIIIGNSNSENSTLWPGENLLSELRNLNCVVIAVPHDTKFEPVQHVCFAYDFNSDVKGLPLGDLASLVEKNNAQLHILNIHTNSTKDDINTENRDALNTLLDPVMPVYHFVESENIDESIHQFVIENQMNWLVVVPHKHSFFEGLFHKSHTKAMTQKLQIPVISLHEKAHTT